MGCSIPESKESRAFAYQAYGKMTTRKLNPGELQRARIHLKYDKGLSQGTHGYDRFETCTVDNSYNMQNSQKYMDEDAIMKIYGLDISCRPKMRKFGYSIDFPAACRPGFSYE